MLQLTDITKGFGESEFVLNKISLSLGKGLHMLVGPNGAGKSTLLRIIATVMGSDAGTFSFNGRDVYSDVHSFRLSLGYLPQVMGFYDHMTGMAFLRYMASLKGISPRLGKERAEYVADLLDIQQYCAREVSTWSVGLRQLLGLAQALLSDPAILILDEPLCGLDSEETEAVGQLLTRLSQDKVILISNHIMNELPITRLLLLINGNLKFAGLPTVFLDEARGRVWSVEISKQKWLDMQHKYSASPVTLDGNRCQCKIVSDNIPDIPGAKAVTPGLEDAYLFWLTRVGEKGAIC